MLSVCVCVCVRTFRRVRDWQLHETSNLPRALRAIPFSGLVAYGRERERSRERLRERERARERERERERIGAHERASEREKDGERES